MTGTRILVVEDDNIVTEYLRLSLDYMGYTVAAVCQYGEDAVAKAVDLSPDLVLMDIKLRGKLNGVEAAEKIRESLDIPVVFLTAHADDETLNRAKVSSPFGYVLKPFRERELRTAIEVALYRHSMERQLKSANDKLRERKSFIESIMDNIQSGLIVTDCNFDIRLVNKYVLDLFDKGVEEVDGKNLGEFVPEILEQINDGANSAEIQVCCSDAPLTVGFTRFDMPGADGNLKGHIIALKNLTEIINIRRELRIKERLATMGELVAKVAHEIRNPLFGMTAVCQIFSKELQLNDDQRLLMDSLMRESWRLKQIVEELLDCSRELKLDKRIFDLATTIKETVSDYRVFAEEKKIRINSAMEDKEYLVMGDQGKIKQVIINLLQNAIDACRADGVINLLMTENGRQIRLSIEDSGGGIPDHAMEKIFDVFYTTKRHGTGLGLPISKNIIEAHNGTLCAQNQPGSGAVFIVTIPILGGVQ